MVIYNNGTAAQIATGLMLHKNEFEAGKVVGVPMAGKLTQMIGIKRAKLQLDIEELAVNGYEVDKMKAAEIKKAVSTAVTNKVSVKEALDTAVEEIKSAIAENY